MGFSDESKLHPPCGIDHMGGAVFCLIFGQAEILVLALKSGHGKVIVLFAAWHKQIVACGNRRSRLGHPVFTLEAHGADYPVRHDQTVISPFLPEQLLHQIAAFRGVDTVEQIVGGHQGGGITFPDTDLKAPDIDLPEGTFADMTVGNISIGLLVVAAEVLHRSALAGVLLYASGNGCADYTAVQRVFGAVLKVSSA